MYRKITFSSNTYCDVDRQGTVEDIKQCAKKVAENFKESE